MKRIVLAFATTLAVMFLLFSYRTSTIGPSVTSTAARAAHIVPSSPSTSAGTATAGNAGTDTQASPVPSASAPVKIDGKLMQTGYGPIVVEITVTDNKIADAQAVTYPDSGGRTRSINSNALPILRTETLKAQGANIDGVSGATHTTDGYVSSLQSAIDLAGLK